MSKEVQLADMQFVSGEIYCFTNGFPGVWYIAEAGFVTNYEDGPIAIVVMHEPRQIVWSASPDTPGRVNVTFQPTPDGPETWTVRAESVSAFYRAPDKLAGAYRQIISPLDLSAATSLHKPIA
jgi:hypothetical protein